MSGGQFGLFLGASILSFVDVFVMGLMMGLIVLRHWMSKAKRVEDVQLFDK